MQKWEYKTLNLGWDDENRFFYWFDQEETLFGKINAGERTDDIGLENRLKELGKEGWELVSVLSLTHLGTLSTIKHYLKRPIE